MTRLAQLVTEHGLLPQKGQDLDNLMWLDCRRLVIHDPVTGAKVPLHTITLRDAVYSWARGHTAAAACLDQIVNGFGGQIDADSLLSDVLEIRGNPVLE